MFKILNVDKNVHVSTNRSKTMCSKHYEIILLELLILAKCCQKLIFIVYNIKTNLNFSLI
jgi:hypothetical protein